MKSVKEIASISSELSKKYSKLESAIKNNILCLAADLLIKEKEKIITANLIDIQNEQ